MIERSVVIESHPVDSSYIKDDRPFGISLTTNKFKRTTRIWIEKNSIKRQIIDEYPDGANYYLLEDTKRKNNKIDTFLFKYDRNLSRQKNIMNLLLKFHKIFRLEKEAIDYLNTEPTYYLKEHFKRTK